MQDEFEATNACVYEMERRFDEKLAEVRSDVSLASAACRQQALSEALRTSKLQLDSLHDRLTTRLQGTPTTPPPPKPPCPPPLLPQHCPACMRKYVID